METPQQVPQEPDLSLQFDQARTSSSEPDLSADFDIPDNLNDIRPREPSVDSQGKLHTIRADKSDDEIYAEAHPAPSRSSALSTIEQLGPFATEKQKRAVSPQYAPAFSDLTLQEKQELGSEAMSPQNRAQTARTARSIRAAQGEPAAPPTPIPGEDIGGTAQEKLARGDYWTNPRTGQRVPLSTTPEEGFAFGTNQPILAAEHLARGPAIVSQNVRTAIVPPVPQGPGGTLTPEQRQRIEQAGRKTLAGGAETIQGATEAGSVVAPAAALNAPLKTAVGIGAGYLTSEAAGAIAHHADADPELEEFLRQVGFFAPSALGVVSGLRTGTIETPNGRFSAASILGGRARAGVAETPEAFDVRAQVGGTRVGVRIPRPQPAPPASDAAKLLGEFEQGTGQTPTPPAPPQPGPDLGPEHLTPDVARAAADAIMQAPEAQRPKLMLETHQKMVQWMMGRGTFTGPDGKIHTVDNEGQAKKLASQFINDQVDAADKAQAEAAKAAETAQPAAAKPAPARRQSKPAAQPTSATQPVPATQQLPTTAPVSGKAGAVPMGEGMTQDSPAVEKIAQEANLAPGQEPLVMVKEETPADVKKLAEPSKPVKPEEVAAIGSKDEESGRRILQPSDDVLQNERMAAEAAPELATKLSHISAAVPGAQFDRMRPQKNLERVTEKEDADKPPETIADYLAAQIAADSPQAKDQLIGELKNNFKVLSVEDKFTTGDKDLQGYPSVKVQVQLANGHTAEVQIVPTEMQEVADHAHHFYTQGRKADVAGDTARRDEMWGKSTEINTAALDRAKASWKAKGWEEPQKHDFANTQINIDPQSELGQAHAQAVASIPEEHLGKEGRESTPHVTIRYGLKDDSSESIDKIRDAVGRIQPFDVPVGKTDIFPASEHSGGDHPVIARLETTPELNALRSAVESAGGFKEDNFPEYKPHVTLGYVKKEFAEQYKGGDHLEGQTVPIREITVSKKDGSSEAIPLGGPDVGKEPDLSAEMAKPQPASGFDWTNLPANLGSADKPIPLALGEVGFRQNGDWHIVNADGTVEKADPTGNIAKDTSSLYPKRVPSETVSFDGFRNIEGLGLGGSRAWDQWKKENSFPQLDAEAKSEVAQRFIDAYEAGRKGANKPTPERADDRDAVDQAYRAGGLDRNLLDEVGRASKTSEAVSPAREAVRARAERRTNVAQRKKVAEMTPEEKDRELLTSAKTGLPNYRAFEDADDLGHVGYADLDDFKSFNTKLGHKAVDSLVLPAVGDLFQNALAKEPKGSIQVFHRSGDEFLFRSKTPEAVTRIVERVNAELANATFEIRKPDGTIIKQKGTGLSHGAGRDEASAEEAADTDKQRRKAAGLRTGARDEGELDRGGTGGQPAPEPRAPERPEVPQEVSQPEPTEPSVSPARAAIRAIAKRLRGDRFRFEEQPPGQPQKFVVSPSIMKLIARDAGYSKNPRGVNTSDIGAGLLAASLRESHPEFADAIDMVRGKSGESGLTFIQEGASPETEREELFHGAVQRELGHGFVEFHLSPEASTRLVEHPVARKLISAHLDDPVYRKMPDRLKVAEVAAKIAADENKLSPEEAADWFTAYYGELERQHGPERVAQVMTGMFDRAKELYEAAKANRATAFQSESGKGASGVAAPSEGSAERPADISPPLSGRGDQANEGPGLEEPSVSPARAAIRARAERKNVAPAESGASTIEAGQNARRELQPETRRPVSDTEGEDRGALGRVPAEGTGAIEEGREAGDGAGPVSGADHPGTARPAGERTESGAGEGDRVPKLAGAGKPRVAKNSDWFSHPEDFTVEAKPSVRLQRNIDALKIVKDVQATGRPITDEERMTLAQYVGWGALDKVFKPWQADYGEQNQWKRAQAELKELLTDNEYRRAENSTQNAHYTSPEVVRFMWQVASRLGFEGGTILEPSMGTGNFFGMMPKGLRGKVNAIGNEMDPSTYYISKLLYPSATIYNQNYVDLMLPHDSVDVAIGNVPFGVDIYDPKYPKLRARIHDYFLVKSIDKVRPGGLMMFITSDGTLDKNNSAIRDILADKADLIHAARLPESAFEGNAGTTVVTDLLVFRKRGPHDASEGEAFKKVVPVPGSLLADAGNMKINEYYAEHPDHIVGQLAMRRGRYGAEPELTVRQDGKLADALKKTLDKLPRNMMRKANAGPIAPGEVILAPTSTQEGNFVVHDGKIMQRINGALVPADTVLDKDGKPSFSLVQRAKHLIGIRDSLTDLINDMRTLPEGAPTISAKQRALEKAYDKYVKTHGYLNGIATRRLFETDPQYPLLLSLEEYDRDAKLGTKADIFTKRTIFPPARLVTLADNPEDALMQVVSERGFPDIQFMSELSGKDAKQFADALIQKDMIYKDPLTGQYETTDKYLSGYVRDKLDDAKKAVAQGQKEFQRNVEALEKSIPPTIPIKGETEADRIDVKLGGTYIPPQAISAFIGESWAGGDVTIAQTAGTWTVGRMILSPEVTSEYSGGGVSARDLLEDTLNLRHHVVRTPPDADGRTYVDQEATVAAQAAQEKIKRAFADWARNHGKWGPIIEDTYNRRFNAIVTRESNGAYMTFPGMVRTHLRDGKLMSHQVNAIRRQVEEGRALLAHAVGAGKTYEGIVGAMELKRLGKIKKAMVVVPNHKVGDWASDWQKLYPGSRLLVPTKRDFEATSRNRLMSRIATGDWDGIIIAHSQFDLMDISAERQQITLDREMDELEATIRAATAAMGKNDRTVKQLQKSTDSLKAKLDALKDLKADKTIMFDQLGVDHLIVDEAQRYKNLQFNTKMQRISGLSQGDSKRALRLKMKTDFLLEKYNKRGVVFLTGTPISNTMAEQRHMTVYVAPDEMEKAGIHYFDDWAANFGDTITAMELAPDGRSYKARRKFARFVNVPEMQLMFRSYADVKMPEDLNLPVPKLDTGGPIAISVPTTEVIEPYIQNIIARAKAIRGEGAEYNNEDGTKAMTQRIGKDGKPMFKKDGSPVLVPALRYMKKPEPTEDNMLKVTTDGRKIATDARLINPDLPDHPGSKINAVVDRVFKDWEEGTPGKGDDKGDPPNKTQLVFLDMYRYIENAGVERDELGKVTKKGKPVERLNLYKDMRQKLSARGVPTEQMAIIHDYDTDQKKMKLFDAVNNGSIRILFGSTQKMGEGMNVQRRLKAIHHVDAPWKPGELEQRNGRGIRQGNLNKELRIYHYVTKGSFDAYMMQTLESKAGFIHQVMSGKFKGRTMIDAASDMVLSLEEMKAIASGNPDVKRKMELDADIARLEALERAHDEKRRRASYDAGTELNRASQFQAQQEAIERVLQELVKNTDDYTKFQMTVLGKKFSAYEDANKWMKDQDIPLVPFHFEFNGVAVRAEPQSVEMTQHVLDASGAGKFEKTTHTSLRYFLPWDTNGKHANSMGGMLQSLNIVLSKRHLEDEIKAVIGYAERTVKNAEKFNKLAQDKSFPEAKDLAKAKAELSEVERRLGINDEETAMGQQVTADVDASDDDTEPEGEEDLTPPVKESPDVSTPEGPAEGEVSPARQAIRARAARSGEAGFARMDIIPGAAAGAAKVAKAFFDHDLAPITRGVAGGLKEVVKSGLNIVAPRMTAPPQSLDVAMKMKGQREEQLFRFSRAMAATRKMFDKMPEADRINFIDNIMRGRNQASTELAEIAQTVRQIQERFRAQEKQFRPDLTDKENYFHLKWKKLPAGVDEEGNIIDGTGGEKTYTGPSRRPLQGGKSFMKRKTLPDASTGIERGGELMSTNPIDLLQHRVEESLKFTTARKAWEEHKDTPYTVDDKGRILHIVQFFKKGQEQQARALGYDKLNDPIAKVMFPAESGEGMIEPGEHWVEANTARLYNNFLSRDLIRESKAGRGIVDIKNAVTAWRLGFSPFHLMTESMLSAGSEVGRGLEHAANQGIREGSLSEVGRGIATAGKGIAAPYAAAREGGAALRYAADPKAFAQTPEGKAFLRKYPEANDLLADMFTGGAKMAMHEDFKMQAVQGLRQAAADNNYIGALIRTPLALNQAIQHPLFEVYIPRLKIGMFLREYSEALVDREAELEAGKLTRAKLARDVWDGIDHRFGEMNWDNLFWNRTFKTANQLLWRAFAWTYGNFKFVQKAGQGQASEIWESAKYWKDAYDHTAGTGGQKAKPGTTAVPRLDRNMAKILGMAMVGIAVHTALQLYFTHELPKDHRDLIAPRDGTKDKNGQPNRWSAPLVPFKDIESAANSPTHYAQGKLADIWTAIPETINNRDFNNHLISHPSDPFWEQMFDRSLHLVGAPVGYSKLRQEKKQGSDTETALLSTLGISRVPKSTTATPAEKKMREIRASHFGPMTDEELEAREQKDARIAAGNLNRKERQQARNDARKNMWERDMKEFSYDQVKQVYDLGDEEEKKEMARILLQKRFTRTR